MGASQAFEIDGLRGGKEGFERRLEPGNRQVLKDPTPVIIDHQDGQAAAKVRTDEQAVGVVKKRQIPGQQPGRRSVPAKRRLNGRGNGLLGERVGQFGGNRSQPRQVPGETFVGGTSSVALRPVHERTVAAAAGSDNGSADPGDPHDGHGQQKQDPQAEKGSASIGYDVIKNEYGDMLERQIIDPAKVTRSAVENAASIAAMILTTEALITDIPEPPAPAPAGPPGGMPY